MKVIAIILFSIISLNAQQIVLRDSTNLYDYVVITTPAFVQSCQAFKQHKESARNFRVLIVDTTQIFGEFNSYLEKEKNIRDFISYAGKYWRAPKPKYFLLAGTVTMIANYNIPNITGDINPYAQSDYYYTQSIYESDTIETDFSVGRIPAKTTTQLEDYFAKVISYENNVTVQPWMNRNLFICEDNPTFGFLLVGNQISTNFPANISAKFFSNGDTSTYFGNKDSILNYLNNVGSHFVWIESSASDSSIISNQYFSLNDLTSLNNSSKYFISVISGGIRAVLDDNVNLASEMMFLPNAGSLGAFVVCGISYWNISINYQNIWAHNIFSGNSKSLFEIFNYEHGFPGFFDYQKKITNLWGDPSLVIKYDATVDSDNGKETPKDYSLSQNYPNPFNPTTTIRFSLPVDKNITLKVYDILGNEVASLLNDDFKKGAYEVTWDGANNSGVKVASGTYVAELRYGNFAKSIKMTLLK